MDSETEKKKLSIQELMETPEFRRLTLKQQNFVASYCGGGLAPDGKYDAVNATVIAYECKSAEVARIMSYSLLSNIRIIAAINRHFNTTPLEAFLVQVERAINNKHLSVQQVQALKLKADILGFGARLPGINNSALGDVSKDVRERTAIASKRKRKPRPAVKPPVPSDFDFPK